MKTADALSFLVDMGVSVERGDWHLYRNRNKQYVLLNLGNPEEDFQEENFSNVSTAVGRFAEVTNLEGQS